MNQVQLVNYRTKQHPTLNDEDDPYQMLEDFARSLPSGELHSCADVTVLLIEQFGGSNTCGVGNTDASLSCGTVSITKKSCATGHYRFGQV